jgi:hypothetical protein
MAAASRLRRIPPLILIVLTLLLALAALIAWNVSRPVVDARVLAIHANGYPVTLAELDAFYKKPADHKNAALAYATAFAKPLLASNLADTYLASNWLPSRGKRIDPSDKAEFEQLLATNKDALDLLYQAAALPSARYPIDLKQGPFTLLPHLSKVKAAAGILSTDALIQAQDGRTKEAVKAFIAATRVADSLANEPVTISQFVRQGSWNAVLLRLERALNPGQFNNDELAELQQTIAGGERTNSLVLAFAGERASSLSIFLERQFQTPMLFSGMSSNATTGESLQSQLSMGLLKATGLFSKDKAFFLDTMSNFVWVAEQPHPQRWIQSQAVPAPFAPNRFWIFSRILLPALGKATAKDVEFAARIRVAQTALAVERFRLAHGGALPESLPDLVPSCCASILRDPFDGALLRYRKLNPGYVVYSIGQDGKDDGGTEYNPKKPAGYDITFRLEK